MKFIFHEPEKLINISSGKEIIIPNPAFDPMQRPLPRAIANSHWEQCIFLEK
jgi:hypothetical protein